MFTLVPNTVSVEAVDLCMFSPADILASLIQYAHDVK